MADYSILVTVDSLRADHLGQYGYERDTMPVLDRLAAEGAQFTNAFSNAPWTYFSVPSFHTSNYIGSGDIGERPTIASTLAESGITTCAIGTHTGSRNLKHGLGFEEYNDPAKDYYEQKHWAPDHTSVIRSVKNLLSGHPRLYNAAQRIYDIPFEIQSRFSSTPTDRTVYASAEELTDKAINWIETHEDEDFFLWLHYMDGHRPYGLHDPDPKYAPKLSKEQINEVWQRADDNPDELPLSEYKLLVDQYDSNLRYCSNHITRLFDALETVGIWDDTNIVFSADHGEEFYDHGMFTHHNLPYDELINVPLLLHGPDVSSTVIEEQRELLDLGPTITDFFGVESPESFTGVNLFEGDERRVIARGSFKFDRSLVAVRDDGWKYITTEDGEYLYNLDEDALEEHNIAEEHPDICSKFKREIPERLFDSEPHRPDEPATEAEKEQLEALGYS
jgi:arylsulfatase A-like enzyme